MRNKNIPFLHEKNYKEEMKQIVEPFLKSIVKKGMIIGSQRCKITYECFPVKHPKAVIVLSHGFCEAVEKYYEWIYYLATQNYTVYALNHRSHGTSTRLGCDNDQVHVDEFQHYVQDLKQFMDEIVIPNSKELKIFLYAHSMGGAIGALFLEQYPRYFTCAVLNAPMMEMDTGTVPSGVAKSISICMTHFKKEKSYLWGHGPFKGLANVETSGTSCEARYHYYHEKRLQNECLQTNGGSFGWLAQSFKAIHQLIQKSHKIQIPVLLFQAEKDTFVRPKGQIRFAKNSKNVQLFIVANAKHEIYFEKDEIMHPYLQEVLRFYDERLKALKNVIQ